MNPDTRLIDTAGRRFLEMITAADLLAEAARERLKETDTDTRLADAWMVYRATRRAHSVVFDRFMVRAVEIAASDERRDCVPNG